MCNSIFYVVSCLLQCLSKLSNKNSQKIVTSYSLLRPDCCNTPTDIELVARENLKLEKIFLFDKI